MEMLYSDPDEPKLAGSTGCWAAACLALVFLQFQIVLNNLEGSADEPCSLPDRTSVFRRR
jgi:hypothetical protein